jgi:hypothetical protein
LGRLVRKLDVMTGHITTHIQKQLCATTDLCLIKYFHSNDTEGQCLFLWCEIVRNMDRDEFTLVSLVMGERIWASFSPLEQCGVQYAICNSVFFLNYTLNWHNRKSTWDYTTNHSAGVFCQSVNWCRANEKRDNAVNISNIMLTTVLRTLGKYLLLFWKQSLKFCSNGQVMMSYTVKGT